MKVGSLFAGIGGFDLAARWMGWSTAWFSEIEPYACKVLKKHWPDVPNHGDITKIRGADVEPVDLLCGGFPCQDISIAGKGRGISGERSGLWAHYSRLIEELRPKYIVAENSPVLRTRGLGVVLQDLMALGYCAEWHCIPAASVGAPHQRDRIWIVAHSDSSELRQQPRGSSGENRTQAAFPPVDGIDWKLADPDSQRREELHVSSLAAREGLADRRADAADVADSNGERELQQEGALLPEWGWFSHGRLPWAGSPWAVEPDVGRVAHGVPARVDRLRCLGNTIVPYIPFLIFNAIARREESLKCAA